MWNQTSTKNNASVVKYIFFFQITYHDCINLYFVLVSTHITNQFFIRLWSYPVHPLPVWANHQKYQVEIWLVGTLRWWLFKGGPQRKQIAFCILNYLIIFHICLHLALGIYCITCRKSHKARLKWHPINLRLLKLCIWWRKWPELLSLEAVNVIRTFHSIMSHHRTCKHEH